MIVRCPICQQSVPWEGNPFRPFCSERCKLIDLDNWLEARYRVKPRVESGEEEGQEEDSADTRGERD